MKSRTQTHPTPRLSRLDRRARITHRHVTHDPASAAYLTTPHGKSFIDGCLQAITKGDWGLVSSSEATANTRAPIGGHIEAAYLVPDHLDIEQILLIDVTNIGTRRAHTTVRLLDPTAVTS